MTKLEALLKLREHFGQPGAVYGYGTIRDQEDGRDLIEQGCVYRGDGNPKSPIRCAMGVLLPDELYQPRFECTNASNVLHFNDEIAEYFSGLDAEWVDYMQGLHDKHANAAHPMIDFLDELDDEIEDEKARLTALSA